MVGLVGVLQQPGMHVLSSYVRIMRSSKRRILRRIGQRAQNWLELTKRHK